MARGPGKKKLAEADGFIRQWRRDHRSLKPYHDAMRLEHGYNLKLKHHAPPDPRRPLKQQPLTVSTLDVYDITRYSSAQIAGTTIYMDVRPSEPGRDAVEQKDLDEAAVTTRAIMDEQVHDVDIGYPRVRRRFVRMAQAARVGAAMLDLVPGGPQGALVLPRVVNPWNLSWDTRYLHPLEYGNRVLWEVVERVPLDEIRSDPEYMNGALVKPDDGHEVLDATDEADPKVDRDTEEQPPTATLVVGWLMDEDDEVDVQVGEVKKLDPSQWYMACGECGYTERDLAQLPEYDGALLPETMPCPMCGQTPEGAPMAMAHRIETEREMGTAPTYEGRNRRIVFAPLSPEAGLLKDGPWPKGLTRFPVLYHVSDPFPLEPTGNSQTFLNMDLQSLKNASLADGYAQMARNRDLIIARVASLWDADHEPYQFDGSGDTVAYVETYDDLQGIKHFQGQGLNQAFPTWMDRMDAELNRHRGVGQAALSPQEMKGVQVGTIARSIETGDVPLDEVVRILREDEEQFFNRWLELLAGNWSAQRWVEAAGPDGETAFRLFNAMATPRMRLRVHAAPDLNAVDREQLRAASELEKITSPTLLRFAAQSAKLPRHVVEGIIREKAALAGPPNVIPDAGGLPLPGAPQGQPGRPAMPEPVGVAVS